MACYVVARLSNYRTILIITTTAGSLCAFVFAITLQLEQFAVTLTICAFLGFLMTPILPISFEFACEITYPAGEATAGGLLNCGAQVFTIIEVLVVTLVLAWPFWANLVLCMCLCLGVPAALLTSQLLTRSKTDNIPLTINLPSCQ